MPEKDRRRALRRHHRRRVIEKRRRLALACDIGDFIRTWSRPRGELATAQQWVGCGRPRCGLCHPWKRSGDATRQRERDFWRWDWEV